MTIRAIVLFSLLLGKVSAKGPEIYPMADSKKMEELPFLFISDNQFNNYLTDPNIIRNTIFDNLNPVAIRPPQLDLFAPDLSTYILNKYASGKYLIHLGDALNISCQNEWKVHINQFNPIINGKKVHKGWVMLPGNHDAFYYGNTAGNAFLRKGFVNKSWKDACNSDSYPPSEDMEIKDTAMTKDILTKRYFKELLKQGKIFPEDFPQEKDVKCVETKKASRNNFREKRTKLMVCDWKSPNPKSFLQRMKFTYPIKQHIGIAYRSYIVQELNMGTVPGSNLKIKGILLDTSDYKKAPRSFVGAVGSMGKLAVFGSYNAGLMGNITDIQGEVVKDWLLSDGKDSLVVFMGHHPYLNISPSSQKIYGEFQKLAPNSFYISSHTHTGFTNNSGPVKEVNVGSITDYPNEFISIFIKKGDDNLIVFPKRIHEKFRDISPDGFCAKSDNYTKRGAPRYRYMSYKKHSKADPNSIHDFTLDTIIISIDRLYKKLKIYKKMVNKTLIKFYKTASTLSPCKKNKVACRAEKFKIIKEILKFDKGLHNSPKYGKNRIRYGACQSLWAAYAEYLKDVEKVPYEL